MFDDFEGLFVVALSQPDHDLLITIAERVRNVGDDVKQLRNDHSTALVDNREAMAGFNSRLTIMERHASDTPGRYVTTEGPHAEKWDEITAIVKRDYPDFAAGRLRWDRVADWFEGVGKWVFVLVPCVLTAAFTLVIAYFMHKVGW